jgi:uncharacterized HAD superfamily protein
VVKRFALLYQIWIRDDFHHTRPPVFECAPHDLGKACGITQNEVRRLFDLGHADEVILNLYPKSGAVNKLRQWADQGYKLAVVTGRPPDIYDVSCEWLRRHHMPHDDFIIVDKYGRFSADKAIAISKDALAAMDFCLAVEDSLEMATYVAEVMATPVALMDCPWNREGVLHPRITRYAGWKDMGAVF